MRTEAAICANLIKKELKKAFPNTIFKVKSDNFAGGDSVHISYSDGPGEEKVNEIVKKYQSGSFDGMTDMYEYTNSRDDVLQAKYVSVSRSFSDEKSKELMLKICEEFGIEQQDDLSKSFTFRDNYINFHQLIWKEYHDKDVPMFKKLSETRKTGFIPQLKLWVFALTTL